MPLLAMRRSKIDMPILLASVFLHLIIGGGHARAGSLKELEALDVVGPCSLVGWCLALG